jgi:aquaporin Z
MARSVSAALIEHWQELLIEGALLGVFMISACLFAALLEHPASIVHRALSDPLVRRALMGLAMGLTAIALIYSRWGKRSGAHMNPSVTLAFYALGRVRGADALLYVLAQFIGGYLGVLAASTVLGSAIRDPSVGYVVTAPGPDGVAAAFVGELIISFVMMSVVLAFAASNRLGPYTGVAAGTLLALFIVFESPYSGTSLNAARSFASALAAGGSRDLWIYFTAPAAGMLLAAKLQQTLRGARAAFCAKLHHHNGERCIFLCKFAEISSG